MFIYFICGQDIIHRHIFPIVKYLGKPNNRMSPHEKDAATKGLAFFQARLQKHLTKKGGALHDFPDSFPLALQAHEKYWLESQKYVPYISLAYFFSLAIHPNLLFLFFCFFVILQMQAEQHRQGSAHFCSAKRGRSAGGTGATLLPVVGEGREEGIHGANCGKENRAF